MKYELVTAPTSEPVTLQEAKRHCDIDNAERDAEISGYITAARQTLEALTSRSYVSTTWRLHLDDFPWNDAIEIRKVPVISVTSVKYYSDEVLTTISVTDYQTDTVSEPARIAPVYGGAWPTSDERFNAVQVNFTAGYTTVPQLAKQAILVLVKHWYENPSAVATGTIATELPLSFRNLANLLRWGALS